MVMYIGHALSLIVYIMVVVTCVSCMFKLTEAKLYGVIKYVIPTFLVSLTLQASTFILLQIDWIFEDFNALVGDTTAYGWLLYDYFNGFALLTFATSLRIWLGWRLDNLNNKEEATFLCRKQST